ncbi:hypothetical protein BSLG_008384 [Batrachochytrium salamandrivorans]|nr:hypothetical protein BSLG_008384 [Batrachochytrium salamandrivorans]
MGLTQPARKPRHLEARFRQRMQRYAVHSNSNGKASPVVVVGVSPREPLQQIPVHSHTKGSARHEAFVEARRRKLAHRQDHIRRRVAAHRTQALQGELERRSQMQAALDLVTQKRNQLLAERVQTLSQTVAHAKKVARNQSERSARLTADLAHAIETRLRVSAMRRSRLQTIPRSRLLDPHSWALAETYAVRSEAATTVQIWWRRCKLAPAISTFSKLQLSLSSARQMPFQQLMELVQSSRLIKAVAHLLLRARRFDSCSTPQRQWRNPARILLAAFMIVAHPLEMLQPLGPQEEALKTLAETMLSHFQAWVTGASTGSMVVLGRKFLDSYAAYYAAFDAWKSRDTVKMVDDLVSHFLDLEALWLSVKDQEGAQEQWAPRIDAQQKIALDRLGQFGPDALEKINTERMNRSASGATASPDLGLQQMQHNKASSTDISQQNQSSKSRCTSPELFQAASLKPASDSVVKSRRSRRRLSTTSSSRSASPILDSNTLSSPVMESAPPSQELQEFGHIFSNEVLAHELLMDPDFKLAKPIRSPLEMRIAGIARQAFFDNVGQEIAAGNYANHVVLLLKEIKQGLLDMVSTDGKIATEINSVLDFDLIHQQITHGVFDLHKTMHYAGEKMLQLCAPMRDASIRHLDASTDMANALSMMLDILSEMKLDLSNYRLQALKPHLQRQSVDYERSKFDNALRDGSVSLERTRAWLSTAVAGIRAINNQRNPERINHPENSVKFQDALHEGVLNLVFGNVAVDPATMAETLVMDAARIYAFQNQAQAVTVIAALVMLTGNIVPQLRSGFDDHGLAELLSELKVLLADKETCLDHLVTLIVTKANASLEKRQSVLLGLACNASPSSSSSPSSSPPVSDAVHVLTSEQETLIKTMVTKTLSNRDPVYMLLSRRVRMTLRQYLDHGVFRKDVLKKYGLDVVASELEDLSTRVFMLTKHNKNVHAAHYDDILRELV